MKKVDNAIVKLHESLQRDQNTGFLIIPEAWKQIAELLIILLGFIKFFTNPKVDELLDEIIEALEKIVH